MNKNLWIAAAVALAGTAGACSSSDKSEEPNPAASQGDEASPQEPASGTPTSSPAASSTTNTTATPGPGATTTGIGSNDSANAQPASAQATPANAMSRPGDEPVAESLRDGQVLKLVDLANSGEIEQAKLALTKATDPQVKKFAAMMVKDHTKAKQQGMQFSKTAKVEQEDSAKAADLQTQGEQTLATLKSVEPTQFDGAYMMAQVAQHQAVLDMLSNTLIPSATNPKLKSELEAMRTTVQQHLGHAQQIQQSLATAH